jgi:hypothetical protein
MLFTLLLASTTTSSCSCVPYEMVPQGLRIGVRLLPPKKQSFPQVERFKLELRDSIDRTISEVEKQIHALRDKKADEAAVKPWLELLASLKEKRRQLSPP